MPPALIKGSAAQALSQSQMDEILSLYTPDELAKVLEPQWRGRMEDIAAQELSELGAMASFEQVNPLIDDHIDKFGLNRLKVPIDTSQAIVRAEMMAGIEGFESIDEIAKRIIRVGATDQGYRARLIARTEAGRSSNVAREIAVKASGLPGLKKRWLSALSPTTRESHAALHNKVIELNELFEFDASLDPGIAGSLSVPGDIGIAAHSCNCGCTFVSFMPEDTKSWTFGGPEHVTAMKAFDDVRDPWEKQAAVEIAKFYEDIERKSLEILGVRRTDIDL